MHLSIKNLRCQSGALPSITLRFARLLWENESNGIPFLPER
jgi:hypothetical protein